LKTFSCHCGNTLHFENSRCLVCDRVVGFLPDVKQMTALESADAGSWKALINNRLYRQCSNFSEYAVCNWMVPVDEHDALCSSCRLNHIIPNLSEPQNLTLWYRIEIAKRRLLYTLYSLNLPVSGRAEDPDSGMAFEFLQDNKFVDEFSNELTRQQNVFTGHKAGMITINIHEADPSVREEIREKMKERYRTLLGHFRHESGHYYWERLIAGTDNLDSFRYYFGDERVDYQAAMKSYYNQGPPSRWQDSWVSAYASAHPWEDWAETWAHYLHIVDTLETAHDFGFRIQGHEVTEPKIAGQLTSAYHMPASFEELIDDWSRLSVALNALNRSMGIEDAYPFVLAGNSLNKLRYMHQIVTDAGS
jgi:hypothetical protein